MLCDNMLYDNIERDKVDTHDLARLKSKTVCCFNMKLVSVNSDNGTTGESLTYKKIELENRARH